MAACALATLARAQPAPIGTATVLADGTIVLDLVARSEVMVGTGRLTYPPNRPQYAMILRHWGGLRRGETKPVLPFP